MDVKKDRGRVKMMRVIVSSCFNPAFRNARGRIQKKIMTVFEKLSPQSTHAVYDDFDWNTAQIQSESLFSDDGNTFFRLFEFVYNSIYDGLTFLLAILRVDLVSNFDGKCSGQISIDSLAYLDTYFRQKVVFFGEIRRVFRRKSSCFPAKFVVITGENRSYF